MISICIPIYNCDIESLLTDLYTQCVDLDCTYEILLIDDASEEHYKSRTREVIREINDSNIIYEELSENIGRSAIRNRLAQKASYPYLVFVDNDAKVYSPHFVSRYLRARTSGIICYGGSVFKEIESDPNFLLRWMYGKKREATPANMRQKSPKVYFSSFNFLIDKRILLLHPFDEKIREYGYEDVLFSLETMTSGYEITHIDNPLIHDTHISNVDFIARTETALDNLNNIIRYNENFISGDFINQIQIMKIASQIDKWKLAGIMAWAYRRLKKILRKDLLSNKPHLLVFDLYKLGYLCNLKTK